MLLTHRDSVFSKATSHYDQVRLQEWSPGATPARISRMEEEVVDPRYVTLVAEYESKIIGFAMAVPSENELRALYVQPTSFSGVGRALLSEIERLAFNAGAAFLEFDGSLNAEGFYKAHGYEEVGRADHVSSSGHRSSAIQFKKLRPDI